MSVLFITATRIGDAVLSTGVLDHVVRTRPGVPITVACGPLAAGLFEAVPGRERTIVLTKGPYARHWRHLWHACFPRRWDTIIDLRASAVTWFLRANTRYWLRPGIPGDHQVVRLGRLLGLDPPPAPRLWLGPQHRSAAEGLIPPGAPVLALAPFANWIGKTWPLDRFIELARRLLASDGILPHGRLAVLGGPEDQAQARALVAAFPPGSCLDLCGRGGLLDVQAALERCAFFVGNDSGVMHMAAAAGIPVVGLFGPTPDAVYGPWGPSARVARTPQSVEELFPPGADAARVPSLMTSLSVEAVEAVCRRLATPLGEASPLPNPPHQGQKALDPSL